MIDGSELQSTVFFFLSLHIKSLREHVWSVLTRVRVGYVRLREMGSCVQFPNCHNRQLQNPRRILFTLSVSIHLSVCQTSSLQNHYDPSATDIPRFMLVLAGWNLHVTNLVLLEMRQVSYKSCLQERLCFLLLAPCMWAMFPLASNSEVGHFSCYRLKNS